MGKKNYKLQGLVLREGQKRRSLDYARDDRGIVCQTEPSPLTWGITNKERPGYVMPSTGGMGTHWFYILGFGILAVLGVVLYNRRFD